MTGIDGELSKATLDLLANWGASKADMNRWWVRTDANWGCPCCGRKKSEIVRLNKHGQLICHLHEHHDHMKDVLKKLFEESATKREFVMADETSKKFVERAAFGLAAHDNTVICSDCNIAEGQAKIRMGAPEHFSFSPAQIAQFILPVANQPHQVDDAILRAIWVSAKPTYDLRIKMAKRFADIAATKQDWYQSSRQTAKQTQNLANTWYRKYQLSVSSNDCPESKLYSAPKKTNDSSWRTKARRTNKSVPTNNDITLLKRTSNAQSAINQLPEGWICPSCNRTKFECVRPSKNKKWSLIAKGTAAYGKKLCNDCYTTATELGKEVRESLNLTDQLAHISPAELVTLDELKQMFKQPLPHNQHQHNNDYINELLPTLEERAKELSKA